MVKFRESAVNAGSRNQQVAVISIFEERVSIVSRFKAGDGDDKVCGSKTRAFHYACIDSTTMLALIVLRGEI